MLQVEFRAFLGVFGRDFSESVVLFALCVSVWVADVCLSVCLSVCLRVLLCMWDGVCVLPS